MVDEEELLLWLLDFSWVFEFFKFVEFFCSLGDDILFKLLDLICECDERIFLVILNGCFNDFVFVFMFKFLNFLDWCCFFC